MTSSTTRDVYSASLVPALQEIQHEFGYLERGALEKYSKKSGVPLYRLQEVASFFPHFFLSPPEESHAAGLPRHGLPSGRLGKNARGVAVDCRRASGD